MKAYLTLMRLDNPVGTLLLLWPTLTALFMASQGRPTIELMIIFTLGTILMRSAGCVINDIADREFDRHVERTENRPLTTGQIKLRNAQVLFLGLVSCAACLLFFLEPLTQKLAVIGLLLATMYPFAKRYTHLPQVVLGAAFSWGIVMAWAEANGTLKSDAILMFTASLLWIVAYDTQYAMVDRNDDLKIGIKSTAILFGKWDRGIIALLQACALFILCLLGLKLGYKNFYWISIAAAAGLFVFQANLIKARARDNCLLAFKNNVWVGASIFLGAMLESFNVT